MAKLTGPLFSLAASGKLANTLVYADWKGIDYVRQYVVPSNPNTAAQQTQRGFLTTALSQWHDTTNALTAADIGNLNFAAGLEASPMSGFNYYVKQVIKALVAAMNESQLFDTTEGSPGSGEMDVVVTSIASIATVTMRYGTTPRALYLIQNRTEAGTPGTTHTFDLTGLTPGVTYFYKVKNIDGADEIDMGVGSFLAA